MKHETRSVESLNALLRAEVGTNPHGGGLAEWRYLPDLRFPGIRMQNGQEVWEDVKTPAGLIVSRRKKIEMVYPLRGEYPDHWAICLWAAPNSEDEWAEIYGTLENFPAQGVYLWHGVETSPCLRAGLRPTMLTTRQYIDAVKAKRKRTMEERAREREEQQAKAKADQINRDAEFFESLAPAFLNLEPGKRGGHVSPQGGFGDSPIVRNMKESYV